MRGTVKGVACIDSDRNPSVSAVFYLTRLTQCHGRVCARSTDSMEVSTANSKLLKSNGL